MTTYTEEDFANARFAESPKYGLATRMSVDPEYQWTDFQGDCWTDTSMAQPEFLWTPVYEANRDEVQQLRARIHKHEEYLKALRRRHGLGACETFKSEFGHGQCDRCGWVKDEHGRVPVPYPEPLSLDTLREAWEQAEVPTEDTPIREGDVLIYPLFAGYCVRPSWGDSPLPEARVLSRAPRREPWEGLTKVLRTTGVDGQAMDPEILASVLYERGVRVTGGDDT